MNRDEENFDRSGFNDAMTALTSLDKLAAIQAAARESFDSDISVGYSKLDGFKYKIYFLIHSQNPVTVQSRTDLAARLSELLSYDEVAVYSENSLSKASFNSNFSLFTIISPENIEGVRKFVDKYTHYIGESRSKSASPIYDRFVELLRESDTEVKEDLLQRLTQDCEEMGIGLEVEIKRQKMDNK
ncbi:MAG: hypothetical protein K2X50_07250 [Gammaproteobacteria bacterium]|nr:hypothetical protein [Gammaproteobacteria bacterium]